jgi:hypothetical protein
MLDSYAGIIPPGPQARVVKLARMLGLAAACVPMLRTTSCVMHPADPVEAKIKRAPDVTEIEHSTAIVQRSSADYHALIARALEHLKENTSESRRSIYAHAATQLVREPRALDPPLPEAEITGERLCGKDQLCKPRPPAPVCLPHFCPHLPLENQRSARDRQGCAAMTKDPTRSDDPELDDLLRRLHLFGQAPSREYMAAVFSGQSAAQTRNLSERQSAPRVGEADETAC